MQTSDDMISEQKLFFFFPFALSPGAYVGSVSHVFKNIRVVAWRQGVYLEKWTKVEEKFKNYSGQRCIRRAGLSEKTPEILTSRDTERHKSLWSYAASGATSSISSSQSSERVKYS